jgi:EpsI family protein
MSAVHPSSLSSRATSGARSRTLISQRLPLANALAIAAALALSHPVGEWLRPTERTSQINGAIDLEAQVPTAFGEWRLDPAVRPILPDPAIQATLDATYSQVLARTYINTAGQRIMLSIAYGDDQSSEATAVHRPEFCYRGQGFNVDVGAVDRVALPSHTLAVQRLTSELGPRREPISYWITLDRAATLPGWGRKISQLRYGLQGQIADGMVMRVSNISGDPPAAYAVHDQFIAQLHAALPERLKPRYFGQ